MYLVFYVTLLTNGYKKVQRGRLSIVFDVYGTALRRAMSV
jgi:hypothetical protein